MRGNCTTTSNVSVPSFVAYMATVTMSKATPPTDDSRNARETNAPPTTITVNNKYGRTLSATPRHAAHQIVQELSTTYGYEYDPTVVPTATGFRMVFEPDVTVATDTAKHAVPYSWDTEMISYSTGNVALNVRTDY